MTSPALPPPPIRSMMIMPNGSIHPVWVQWFQAFYDRVGGAVAPDNQDLSVISVFSDLNQEVTKQDVIEALKTFIVMQDGQKSYENRFKNIEVMAAYGGF